MKILIAILLSASCFAQVPKTEWVNELGLTFPLKNSPVKNFIDANGITTLPLTSGVGNGVEIGRHAVISNQATIGGVVGANFFVGSNGFTSNQIYQLQLFLTGRLYFDETWRGGFYGEVGSGMEFSVASLDTLPVMYQANIGARIGAGYNYRFNNDVTIGLSLVAAPSLSVTNFVDGIKLKLAMLW